MPGATDHFNQRASMNLIQVTDLYTQAAMARAIPAAWFDKESKAWVLDLDECDARSAAVTLKLFPVLGLDHPELIEIQEAMIQDVRPFDNATPFNTEISPNAVQTKLEEEGKQYFRFQTLDLGYLQSVLGEHGGAYLGWERGMGKTIGALSLLSALECRDTLIVAPNSAKGTVWYPEVEHYFGTTHHIFLLPNQKAKRELVLRRVLEAKQEAEYPIILIVHYEALDLIAKERKDRRGWDKYGEWDLIIADEIHRIKNVKAKMTRALKKIMGKMRLGLSGSIIQNHAEELFSPLQWLYPKHYKSKWRDWNDRYLDYVEGGYTKVFVGILPGTLEALRRELGVFMVYRRKEDELDMPERVDEDIHVELTTGQRKAYDELVAGCLTQLEDDTFVVADEGLPMLIKLRQIATGLDLLGDVADSSKLDLAQEMLQDNVDEQFVVFSWFKASCDALQERMDEGVVIHGDVPMNKRDDLIAEFTSGEARILFCTISTMGESQNFQNANNVIFLDRSWNPSDNTQAEDRVYRIGQENKVTITHIIAKDTVDDHRVSPTIVNKDLLRRLILGG